MISSFLIDFFIPGFNDDHYVTIGIWTGDHGVNGCMVPPDVIDDTSGRVFTKHQSGSFILYTIGKRKFGPVIGKIKGQSGRNIITAWKISHPGKLSRLAIINEAPIKELLTIGVAGKTTSPDRIATLSILIYAIPLYWGAVTQWLMLREYTIEGFLAYPNFMETLTHILPMYTLRIISGVMFLTGFLLMVFCIQHIVFDTPPLQHSTQSF